MLPILAVAAVGIVVLLIIVAVSAGRGGLTGSVKRSFHCPYRDVDVTVEYQQETWDGRLTGVTSCSAFEPAWHVRCGAPCLDLPVTATSQGATS